MKKIYIIIGSIIAIVVTLAFITPLAQSIEDMTSPSVNITPLTEDITFSASDVSGNINVVMNILTQETLDYILNNNVYLETPEFIDFTIDTTKTMWTETLIIRVLVNSSFAYNTDTDPILPVYYEIDPTYELLQTGGMILNLTEILKDKAIGVDFLNAVPLRFTIVFDVLEPASSALPQPYVFNVYNYGYNTPQITGTTATLLNIIPFVLISAIILTATVLIKKEGD